MCVVTKLRAVDVRSSHQFEEEIGAASSENGLFIAKMEFSVRTGERIRQLQLRQSVVHSELRGSISTWGNDLDGVCGIDGQLCDQQVDGEEAANALERARGASVITSSDTGRE